MAAFYKIEDAIRGQLPERRRAVRVEHTAPLTADLHAWLETSLRRNDMAEAIRFSYWTVTLILRDGRACIDNSAAERAMRPVAFGWRNWTFCRLRCRQRARCGHLQLDRDREDQRLQPRAYLCHLNQRVADNPFNRVTELLPCNLDGIRPGWINAKPHNPLHLQLPAPDAYAEW
jgi:transposase